MDGTKHQPAAARAETHPGVARRATTRLAALRSRDGLVPVCSWCRRVRTTAGAWVAVDQGLLEGAELALTHGVCPDCARDLLAGRRDAA
jgi:hypothetical protein